MSKSKIFRWLLAFCICAASFNVHYEKKTRAANLVIVLDAGHDDSHTGASGNGLREERLNLQIALACKRELETYEGVTVYMVRDSGPCPYGGQSVVGSSAKCNLQRVNFAQSVGANAYVSIHNNSSTNTSARGAGVYYPTTNYNYACGVTGQGLAQSVLNQLLTTGLNNRGLSVRYSEDNTRYPDGSLADYYGVIKNSKLRGIPGIIIEHAFVSNPSDAAEYLNTAEKLNRLGELDATGIARYYGLRKKVTLDYSNLVLSNASQNNNTQYAFQAANIFGADNVSFAVWSIQGGQDDLKWYAAGYDGNGRWNAAVPIAGHATEGEYICDTYINGSIFAGRMKFNIQGPSVSSVTVTDKNEKQGVFSMEWAGVTSGTDIASVSAAIWTREDQSDLEWVELIRGNDNVYRLQMDIARHGYRYGEYYIHTYVRDRNNILKCVNMQTVTLNRPQTQLEIKESGVSPVLEAEVSELPYGNRFESVEMKVWPKLSGEGAAIAYTMEKEWQGSWKTRIYPAEFGITGTYCMQAYAVLPNQEEVLLASAEYEVPDFAQVVEGVENEQNQRIFEGNDLKVITNDASLTGSLHINPWCNYAAIRNAFAEKNEYLFKEFIAYHLSMNQETEETTGEAVTSIVFQVPDYMRGKNLSVYRSDGAAVQITPLEIISTGDGTSITVQSKPDGLFILTQQETRQKGDADANGEVDLSDALLVLRAALNIQQLDPSVEPYCDITGNGIIDLDDALHVLRAALRIEVLS